MITVTALKQAPPVVQGLVRDLRVRWALEEAGLAYRSRLVDADERQSSAYRAIQPFGQVPVFQEGGVTLFESGAIVLHIGERSETLLPADATERTRVMAWVFAAVNSVEPSLLQLVQIDLFAAGQDWAKARRPAVEQIVRRRLDDLAAWLGDREYLLDRFTAADLVMTTVLRLLRHGDLVASVPMLHAYHARCEARPAFQRALAAQISDFAPA